MTVSPFLVVSAVTRYFVQPFGLWLSAACGALLRYLIFIGIFGFIPIAWVIWRLWVLAPGHQP